MDADLRRALAFVTPYWRKLSAVVVLSLLSTALSLYLPLLSRDFFDRALLQRDAGELWRVSALFGLATLAGFVLNVFSGLRYTRVSAQILFDMRLGMYRHLQRLSPRFYARTRLGDIMSRINNDIGEIQRIAAETALAWVGNVLFLAGTFGMLLWLDWRLLLVSLATTPFGLWALVHYRGRLEQSIAVLRNRSADIGSFLVETIQAMRLVVASNAQAREVDRFRDKNGSFIDALMTMQLSTYVSGGLPGLMVSASSGLVFLYGGYRVVQGSMTPGTFVAFMAYQMRFLPPLQALMGLYSNLAAARVSLNRVYEVLDEPVDVAENTRPIGLPTAIGNLEFDNVTLSYDRGRPAVEGLSFKARAGEVIAIVGPSGSGKSTIADLMLRLLDPDMGSIRLDGRDLRTLRLHDLRRHVALVDQQPCMLHASVAENIRYARPDASDGDIRIAARRAAIADFIERLPAGYDTVVGERGAALSAGERQRIAAARAFLSDPAVLVLDEPTASLDPESERLFIDGYSAVMRNRTTIVITHRLDLARRADHVIVLDGARIVEQGKPDDLARRHQGRFATLFDVQYVH